MPATSSSSRPPSRGTTSATSRASAALLPGQPGPAPTCACSVTPTTSPSIDTGGVVVPAGGRRVAVVGLDDVVVVDTPDALLVTTRARAQDVKAVVDALKAQGRTDLT